MIKAVIIAALVLGTLDVARAAEIPSGLTQGDVPVWALMYKSDARAPVNTLGMFLDPAKCERARKVAQPQLRKLGWGKLVCIVQVMQ